MSGIDEDMEPSLSNADNDAKNILTDYYSQLHSNSIDFPFRLQPIVKISGVVKPHSSYYFGQPSESRPLNILNRENKAHKQVGSVAWKGLMKNIMWMDTFSSLVNGVEDLDRYLKEVEYSFPSSDEEAAKILEKRILIKKT